MDNTLHIIAIWMHILGIALFVGPQFFLAYGWVAASREITDMPTRIRAMRVVTRRFGYIGGAGLAIILIAGTYLIATWRDYYSYPDDASFTGVPYGVIFIIKMNVLAVMLIVLGIHMFWAGPRLIDAIEAETEGRGTPAQTRSVRMVSMALSITGLALALAIMVMGAMMNTKNYSLS